MACKRSRAQEEGASSSLERQGGGEEAGSLERQGGGVEAGSVEEQGGGEEATPLGEGGDMGPVECISQQPVFVLCLLILIVCEIGNPPQL